MDKKNSQGEDRSQHITDRHLDIPSEANRDKHVNFIAQERGDEDPGSALTDDNKLLKRSEKKNKKDK